MNEITNIKEFDHIQNRITAALLALDRALLDNIQFQLRTGFDLREVMTADKRRALQTQMQESGENMMLAATAVPQG